MKNWVWIIILSTLGFYMATALELPMWAYLILAFPVFAFVATYGSFMYSFRSSLKPRPIPPSGYSLRIKDLQKDETELNAFGFEKKDSFYLKTVPDSVVYMFKHQQEPIIACLYHLEAKKVCDFVSNFGDDITLTTSETADGAMVPLPPRRLFQIFENIPREKLLGHHRKAVAFIKEKGKREHDVAPEELRRELMKSMREFADTVKKYTLWPLRLIFWTVTGRGKMHCKTIEEQYKAGMIKIL
jgi:hypothetical protein